MKKKNPFEEKIELYESFIKEEKIAPLSIPRYKGYIADAKKILKLFSEDKMTPKKFNKLRNTDKWEISWNNLLKNIAWCCNNCGLEQDDEHPYAPFFEGDSVHCSNCDNMLSNRTNGGQNNIFNYTYKKKKS